jgi:PAS domain S-box-containing protein
MDSTSSKGVRIGCLFILLLVSILGHPGDSEARRTVRAGIYNFKPLLHTDAEGSPQGFFVKALNRVAEKENWDVQYVPGTWQQALDRIKSDQIDLILCIGYTEERARFLDFPREFLVLDWGLVYKPKGSNINTIMDLEGKTVCGLRGSVFSSGFLDLLKQFQIKVNFLEMDQMSDVFKALDSGKADAGVTSNIPGILNEAAHLVDRTPIIFTPVKLGFAVNAGKNADLIAALDRDITELKADRASVYYHELAHLFGKKDAVLPREAYWVLSGISVVLLVSIAFIVVLRRKVRQKTAELSQQGNLMKSIINGTTDAVFIKDTAGRYIVVNDEVVRLFGRSREEILGRDDTCFFALEEARFLMVKDRGIMEGNRVVTNEERITTMGESRVYLATKGPLYDKLGCVSGMFGISRDITSFKRAETESHRYSQLLTRTGEIALVGGWELDLGTMELFWSEQVRRIHEVGPEVAVSVEDAIAFYAPEARPVIQEAVHTLIGTGAAFDLELPLVTAQGNQLWVRAQGEAEYGDGKIVKIFGSFQNVTERKQMEEKLRQSNEQLRFVLEGSELGFWDWNMEAGEVARNERWAEMLGYTLKEVELTIQQWSTLMHPDDQERAWKSIDEHLEGRAPLHEVEYRMLAKDGQYRWILDRARVVQWDADGRPVRMSGTHTDITERKRADEEKQSRDQQMQHAQRLESLGVLSGGIAHDFNNILAIIIGHCALAKLDSAGAQSSISEIERAAERAAELCRQMLAYAGKSQFVQGKVDFGELVVDMVKMLKPTISQKVEIKIIGVPEIPTISGDASQLRQIAMNLVINASEAIGTERGQILVSLSVIEISEDGLDRDYLGKAMEAGQYVCLEISDNGCGMDEETMTRIFEPFYTTKFTGRGLGMSAVLGIITSHKGALQVSSGVGQGTTFKVYLPVRCSDAPEESCLSQIEASVPWQGSGTVLLVEDECQVRAVARILLESFGLSVLEAGNGKEALECYRWQSAEINLVVTDMGMPVMDGYELFVELKKLDPGLPIIISSGFGDADVATRFSGSELAGLISKPYNIDQLREVLKVVLVNSTAGAGPEL